MVNVVFDESAAYYANVFKGDLITEINGKEIKTLDDYYSIIEEAALSGQVSLKLLRNNIPLEITYTL
jgi:S1-C subfamily serine protease